MHGKEKTNRNENGLAAVLAAVSPESWSPLAKKQPALLFIRSSAAIGKGPQGPIVIRPRILRMPALLDTRNAFSKKFEKMKTVCAVQFA
jgi:hypothetical protein